MITEVILISGWIFWAVISAVVLVEIVALSSDAEDTKFPVAVAVTALIATALFTDAFEDARVLWFVVGLAGYLALGAVWSVKKWWTFVVDARDDIRRQYDERYDEKYMKEAKPDYPHKSWDDYSKDRRPVAVDNKQRIVTWMGLWPFSFTWWCLTWPRRVFVWAYERMVTLYDRISDRIWAMN